MPTLGYVQRLYDFLRRHPTGVDTFWALPLLGLSGLWVVFDLHGSERALSAIFAIGLCLVVALRRKAPVKMLLLTAAIGVGQLLAGIETMPADFAMFVIAYTVASSPTVPRWASRCALAGALGGPALSAVRFRSAFNQRSVGESIFFAVLLTVPFVLAWVLGDSMRTRRAYWAQLEEKAARLEKEREAQSRIAVAAERARIARELHDVVAHNVSVMVVQADGAAYVLDAAPEQTRQALETISGTGRQALAEMRRLLGVLRTGEQPESGEYVPQPGVEQLSDLMEQVRGAGLHVDFQVEGEPAGTAQQRRTHRLPHRPGSTHQHPQTRRPRRRRDRPPRLQGRRPRPARRGRRTGRAARALRGRRGGRPRPRPHRDARKSRHGGWHPGCGAAAGGRLPGQRRPAAQTGAVTTPAGPLTITAASAARRTSPRTTPYAQPPLLHEGTPST